MEFKDLSSKLVQLSKSLVSNSSKLPEKEEMNFLTKQPANKKAINSQNQSLVALMNKLTYLIDPKNVIPRDNFTIKFKAIEEPLDQLIENIGIQQDKKLQNQDKKVLNKANKGTYNQSQNKPQILYGFQNQIDIQLGTHPFIPVINHKFHAKQPLPESIKEAQDHGVRFFKGATSFEFPHPYQLEIDQLEFTQEMLSAQENIVSFTEMNDVIYIDSLENLERMIEITEELLNENGQTEIAVDLEHHHQHSYLGITCLIQITLRNQMDFIIDPFPLWKDLKLLGKIFHNPKIVKILHGADSDVQWLQRDFGLYLVNLFDTYNASKILQFQSNSLSYLLEHYCKQYSEKKYQLADWRERPINEEMLKYAQMDTHYLLYIYDRIKIDLQNLGLRQNTKPLNSYIIRVFEKSKETSLKTYTKPFSQADLSLDWILLKCQQRLDDKTYNMNLKLIDFREMLGIKYDENSKTILPNHLMFKLAHAKPQKLKDLYFYLNGEHNTHYAIKENYQQLLSLFAESQENSKEERKVETFCKRLDSLPIQPLKQIEKFILEDQKIIFKKLEKKNTVIINENTNENKKSLVQSLEQSFKFENAFQLTKMFNPELGAQLMEKIQREGFAVKKEQKAKTQKFQEIKQAQDDEFIALPKLDDQFVKKQQKQQSIRLFEQPREQEQNQKKRRMRENQENSGIKKRISQGENIFSKLE